MYLHTGRVKYLQRYFGMTSSHSFQPGSVFQKKKLEYSFVQSGNMQIFIQIVV